MTGDEAYGQVSALRRMLDERGMSYVLAVPSSPRVHPVGGGGGRIDTVVAALDPRCWTTITVGAGAKGSRTYQWARARVRPIPEHSGEPEHWLLARRSLSDPGEIAYYLAAAPAKTTLRELARIAGVLAIEETFQTAKTEVGLDHYRVRPLPQLVSPRHPGHARAPFLPLKRCHSPPPPHPPLPLLPPPTTSPRACTRSWAKGGPGASPPPSAS